jgi:hypothetical protein
MHFESKNIFFYCEKRSSLLTQALYVVVNPEVIVLGPLPLLNVLLI